MHIMFYVYYFLIVLYLYIYVYITLVLLVYHVDLMVMTMRNETVLGRFKNLVIEPVYDYIRVLLLSMKMTASQ